MKENELFSPIFMSMRNDRETQQRQENRRTCIKMPCVGGTQVSSGWLASSQSDVVYWTCDDTKESDNEARGEDTL